MATIFSSAVATGLRGSHPFRVAKKGFLQECEGQLFEQAGKCKDRSEELQEPSCDTRKCWNCGSSFTELSK